MINLRLIKNQDDPIIYNILSHPQIFELLGGSKGEVYEAPQGYEFLEIKHDNVVIGLFSLKERSIVLLEGHIALLPEYWGKALSDAAMQAGLQFLKRYTKYKQIMTTVPDGNNHVVRYLIRNSWNVCGILHNASVKNGQLINLVLYEKSI